jgi:hypothetical protein
VQFKIVPPPRPLAELREMAAALPAVPRAETDCCGAIVAAMDLSARDDARTYLTFLRALGLAATDGGRYYRVRPAPDDDALARTFRERVFLCERVLGTLADDALTPAEAFEHVREHVPEWERHRHEDWEAEWRERVARLLAWAHELGLAERAGTDPLRYRPA